MRIRLSDDAQADLSEAAGHYDDADHGLGSAFLTEFDAVLERIAMFPEGAPPVLGYETLRRARFRRFPFGVFYQRLDDGLVVVRVLHTRRDITSALGDA